MDESLILPVKYGYLAGISGPGHEQVARRLALYWLMPTDPFRGIT